MEMDEFENTVRSCLVEIPERFRAILEKEQIQVIPREKVPQAVKEKFPSSYVFGVFVGVPYGRRKANIVQHEPTRIELYKETFERVFGNRNESKVRDQIARTVIHEIAHYFGYSEKAIRQRGY